MSERYDLIILPEAEQDIRDIVLYIAQELSAPQAALDLQSEFRKKINSLATMPKRFKTIEELPWKNAVYGKQESKTIIFIF